MYNVLGEPIRHPFGFDTFGFNGGMFINCLKIMKDHMAKSSSIDSLSGTKVSKSLDSSAWKLASLKCLKHW